MCVAVYLVLMASVHAMRSLISGQGGVVVTHVDIRIINNSSYQGLRAQWR